MRSQYAWLMPVLIALLASVYFVQTLPATPRIDGEGWVGPLGVKPLADDAREYLALADSLRQDREYAFSGEATRMRQPLYPLLIASVQAIDGDSLKPLQYLQTLLIAASVGITYLLGTRLLNRRAALLGALVLALFTPFTVRGALVMSEALFVTLFLAALLVSIRAAQRPTRGRYVVAGALWGLAALTRTAALPVPFALAPLLFFGFTHRRRMDLANPAVMLAAFLLVLSPWAVRNAVAMEAFTPTPSQGGIALWAASHPDSREFVDRHMAYAWELLEFFSVVQGKHPSDPGADARLTSVALVNIRADPVGWAGRNAAKLAVVGYQSLAQELGDAARVRRLSGQGATASRLVTVASVLALVLIVVGAAASVARNRLTVVPLAVAAIGYVVQFPVFAEARYFLALAPLYALFLAVGLLTVAPPIKAWLDGAASQEREREVARSDQRDP